MKPEKKLLVFRQVFELYYNSLHLYTGRMIVNSVGLSYVNETDEITIQVFADMWQILNKNKKLKEWDAKEIEAFLFTRSRDIALEYKKQLASRRNDLAGSQIG